MPLIVSNFLGKSVIGLKIPSIIASSKGNDRDRYLSDSIGLVGLVVKMNLFEGVISALLKTFHNLIVTNLRILSMNVKTV